MILISLLSLTALLLEEPVNNQRIPPVVAAIVAHLAPTLGPHIHLFATCMGTHLTSQCGQTMLDCAARGNATWDCIGGMNCGGKLMELADVILIYQNFN